jgi:hypothetical protein
MRRCRDPSEIVDNSEIGMNMFSKNATGQRRPHRSSGYEVGKARRSRTFLVAAFASLSVAACSAAPKQGSTEAVGKTAAALDRPGVVFTPTQYTISLSEVDVTSAVEPTNGICNLWTSDVGYVDWAQLGVQVDSQTPSTAACTLNDANGNALASTGTKLTKCGTNASNNSLFFEGQPLAIPFTVTRPNDTIKVGLALDNIESNSQALNGQMQTTLPNGFAVVGDSLQLVGAALALTGVGADVGAFVAGVGGAISIVGDEVPGSGPNGLGPGQETSCAGGLMGNPTQSATSTGSATYDAPPPDTMWLNFTPAQLDNLIAASAGSAGIAGCPATGCNAIDFYPTMTGLGPPAAGCSNIGGLDVGFPGGGPAFDYGCSSKLHVRLTVTRNWATGPAASAKSADMAVTQFSDVVDLLMPDPNLNGTQLISYEGLGSSTFYNGVIPDGSVFGTAVGTTSTTIPAVVSRTPSNVDAFYVANSILFTAYTGPQSDYEWQVSSLSFAPATAAVTATARTTENLDVFLSSTDGNVYDTYWSSAAAAWNQHNITTDTCIAANGAATANSAPCVGSAVSGGGIAAVALDPGNMNVFYIGTDGGIWDSWWIGSNWNTWEIYGPSSPFQQGAGMATPGGSITAVARTATNIDVYYIGKDGGLWTSSWANGASWGSWEIPGSAGLGRAGTPISAVARQPNAVDVVFESDSSAHGGFVEWASWTPASGWQFTYVPTTDWELPNENGADALSIVAPTAFSLQLSYLQFTGELEVLPWSDPTQCNTLSPVGCTSQPTDFPWSGGGLFEPPTN